MNLNIPNQEMLVIDSEGNKLGVMGRDAALRIAHEKNLDLIEIASQAISRIFITSLQIIF